MKMQYEGIGKELLSFAVDGSIETGAVCKLTAGGVVKACTTGEDFIGVVEQQRDKLAAVALGGACYAAYSGTAPAIGWCKLSADGAGGVKADSEGRALLVLDVDTVNKTVCLYL